MIEKYGRRLGGGTRMIGRQDARTPGRQEDGMMANWLDWKEHAALCVSVRTAAAWMPNGILFFVLAWSSMKSACRDVGAWPPLAYWNDHVGSYIECMV